MTPKEQSLEEAAEQFAYKHWPEEAGWQQRSGAIAGFLAGHRHALSLVAPRLGEVRKALNALLVNYSSSIEEGIVSRRCVSYAEAREWNEDTPVMKDARAALVELDELLATKGENNERHSVER